MNVKTNRSFFLFIVLTILTCGIYTLFFWHSYVKDVNTICAGDGKKTNGIALTILLSLITFGIYTLIWTYGMQNRLRDNASKYNAGPIASGGNILCWQIFGSLLFGIGPWIAMYKQIDSINRLTYNYTSAMNKSFQNSLH